MNLFSSLVSIAFGSFFFCAAVFDLDSFMDTPRVQSLAMLLGRTGTRIFYAVLGMGLIMLGVLIA